MLHGSGGRSKKEKLQDMNWKDWTESMCVVEPRWEEEAKKIWDCTTCKTYIKMTHLSNLWSYDYAKV